MTNESSGEIGKQVRVAKTMNTEGKKSAGAEGGGWSRGKEAAMWFFGVYLGYSICGKILEASLWKRKFHALVYKSYSLTLIWKSLSDFELFHMYSGNLPPLTVKWCCMCPSVDSYTVNKISMCIHNCKSV